MIEYFRFSICRAVLISAGVCVLAFAGCSDAVMKRIEKANMIHRLKAFRNSFADPKVREICLALHSQDIAKIEKLIAEGADVNAVAHVRSHNVVQKLPLLVYAANFEKNGVECLLKHGADPNVFGSSGISVLSSTIEWFSLNHRSSTEHVKILLKYGADPELGTAPAIFPALHAGLQAPNINFDSLVLIVQAGVDLNIENEYYGGYPVTQAATQGSYRKLLYILESGACYDPKTIPGSELHRLMRIDMQSPSLLWTKEEHQWFRRAVQWLENKGISFDEPLPPGTIKPEPFRVNNKLIEWRKKNAEKQKKKEPEKE